MLLNFFCASLTAFCGFNIIVLEDIVSKIRRGYKWWEMCLTWINPVIWWSNFRKLFTHFNAKYCCLLSWWKVSQPLHHSKGGEEKKHKKTLKLLASYKVNSQQKILVGFHELEWSFFFFIFLFTLLILMTILVFIVGSIWHTQLNLDRVYRLYSL